MYVLITWLLLLRILYLIYTHTHTQAHKCRNLIVEKWNQPEKVLVQTCESIHNPAGIYLFKFTSSMETPSIIWNLLKVNYKDTRMTLWRRSGIFIVNLEQILHIVLVFLLLLPLIN